MSGGAPGILVVEDDPHLAAGVIENLRAEGYEVHAAADGEQALRWLRGANCVLVVLDVMLPGIDGFAVCRSAARARATTPRCCSSRRAGILRTACAASRPVAMTTWQSPSTCRNCCCGCVPSSAAATGYPPASRTPPRPRCFAFGGNEVDFRCLPGPQLERRAAEELTEKEAMILKVLAEHGGEIVSREDLLEKVWGYDVFPSTRTVDNFILRLRKRFERDPADPKHFLTVWGVGYRFLRGRWPVSARPLRIGTRASALALWQANHVKALLEAEPGAQRVELVHIKTAGDLQTQVPL